MAPKYVESCTIAALNKEIHNSHIQEVVQNSKEFRHRQFGVERTERGSKGGPDLLIFGEIFMGILDLGILVGHLGLHHSSPK